MFYKVNYFFVLALYFGFVSQHGGEVKKRHHQTNRNAKQRLFFCDSAAAAQLVRKNCLEPQRQLVGNQSGTEPISRKKANDFFLIPLY